MKDTYQNLQAAASSEETSPSAVSEFTSSAIASFNETNKTTLKGVTQLVNHVLAADILPDIKVQTPAPTEDAHGAARLGQIAGQTAAAAIPMIALYKFAGPGAATKLELNGTYGLDAVAMPLAKSFGTGAALSGITTPSRDNVSNEEFWNDRLTSAAVGGLTFMTATGLSIGSKSLGASLSAGGKSTWGHLMQNDIASGTLCGAIAGPLSLQAHALITTGHGASKDDLIQAMTDYAVGGAMMGGANSLHESVKPTSQIQGVRTLADMKALADSTIVKDHRPMNSSYPPELTPDWVARANAGLNAALNDSPLPKEYKDLVLRGQDDLLRGLAILPENRPRITVFGSARHNFYGPDSFDYNQIRYITGKLAPHYDFMTGGGSAIMEAASRGGREGGATTIGQNIVLPFEQAPNPYLDKVVTHQNFFTRTEVLELSDAFIIGPGGMGSVHELAEKLALMQNGKTAKVPVYITDKSTWGDFDRMMKTMVAKHLVSPQDLELYKFATPDQIISELTQRATTSPAVPGNAQHDTTIGANQHAVDGKDFRLAA
jgi:uncharacterized protein (TIGR00730 family)